MRLLHWKRGERASFRIMRSMKPDRLRSSSYQEGYADGQAHGKLHGTFEGRQIGTEKGFELWQELGHVEAVARIWLRSLTASAPEGRSESRKRQKLVQQLESLLSQVAEMPMDNSDTVDIGAAMERIRAKYKLASFTFGAPTDRDHGFTQLSEPQGQDPQNNIVIKGRHVDISQLHF